MKLRPYILVIIASILTAIVVGPFSVWAETVDDYSLLPPFVNAGVPPLVMLTMARNHKLYYEAYNDISDLDGDGVLDIGYKGYNVAADGSDHSASAIDYYGYFDSFKCYEYDSTNDRFNPVKVTANKVCNSSSTAVSARTWSGDFLNYLTMSRMDTLRKVLFGGYRVVDSTSETVLERVFIPQDAHTWGKEYGSYYDSHGNLIEPAYNITDLTPLDAPPVNKRHLFASTSLGNSSPPVLRVMPNSSHRIWEWVSKERPVADDSLEDLSGGGVYTGHPANTAEFKALVDEFATSAHLQGAQEVSQINGSGNPFGDDDYYLTVFDGKISIPTGKQGTYYFAVNGDDAVEVFVDGGDTPVAGWYGGHGSTSFATAVSTYYGSIDLSAGEHIVEFHHQEATGSDNYTLYWKGPASDNAWQIVPASAFVDLKQSVYDVDRSSVAASVITDYEVRVTVCDAAFPESNCKQYPDGTLKPVGLLQKHGETDRMYFGLMTGSYTKNTSGGVLRKNIGSITDEINLDTGQFTSVNGIISTINKLRIVDFDYGSHSYNSNCGWITTRPIAEGECRMWGNPIGEMMFETLRYFAGKGSPTTTFKYGTDSGLDDNELGLPKPAWQDPYATYAECAKPFMLVLSDPNNNFDSDSVPGSYFSNFSSDISGFDAEDLADFISLEEAIGGKYFIGQSASDKDGAPTEKSVDSLGDIRGLAPEEPTKQGSYYPASVAYFGRTNEINAAAPSARLTTFSVALSSPLPRIEIDTDGNSEFDITIVPFAKSVGGNSISASKDDFQPTNTIVDVFMQEQTPTYGKFRINFEDVEQGADHDMDAIAIYEYFVNNDGTLTINVNSEYAAGGMIQHMGYVISGTTHDGTYLVVRDADTGASSDPDYFLDTPPGVLPGGDWDDNVALPLTSTRTFTQSGTPATILQSPLWYAAKWGGFEEKGGTANAPDLQEEWDEGPGAPDGDPDTYFYVTNPLYLEQQLGRSFADILRRSSSGTAASVISSSRSGEGAIYQSLFYTTQTDSAGNSVVWTGQTHSLFVDAYGNMREDTNRNGILDMTEDKIVIFTENSNNGGIQTVVDKYLDVNGDGQLIGDEETATDVSADVNELKFVWTSSQWLNELSDADVLTNRSSYISATDRRYIMTFIDADHDMIADSGEMKPFVASDNTILPYVHGMSPFDITLLPEDLNDIRINDLTDYSSALTAFQTQQRQRVINYIRGEDQGEQSITVAGHTLTLPAMRPRKFNQDSDNNVETWRLGDIVYSTPTVVGTPSEDYDLLYYDSSYTDFYLRYQKRRNVVYVGANDGMLHAFNGGFYDSLTKGFYRAYDPGETNAYSNPSDTPVLGEELWAYVPFNLLPHLYWLTDQGYDLEKHVAYMDLKPRIFDAKIFTADDADGTHPHGWGTVMVVGMRFGGGALAADTNFDNTKTDASSAAEPVMRSAYVVMDITDPEQPPKLLAELSFPDLGFTTSYPTVAVFEDRGDLLTTPSSAAHSWYLAIGSGPYDSAAGGAGGEALSDATSDQSAKVYLVDLEELAKNGALKVIDSSGAVVTGAVNAKAFASVDSNAFVSDLVTADFDMDYKADAIYFGTVSGDFASGWGGKMRRLVFNNDDTPSHWGNDSTLINLDSVKDGQPITAAPAIGLSKTNIAGVYDRWVFFGTGRFFNRKDVSSTVTADDIQSYYGIKEPLDLSSGSPVYTWSTVSNTDLLDTTRARVFEDGYSVFLDYLNTSTLTDFNSLLTKMRSVPGDSDFVPGWRFDLTTARERNLGQASLLGELLTFTTYIPAENDCEIEGQGNLYAPYFLTGTAYKNSILGYTDVTINEDRDGDSVKETTVKEVARNISIGRGMTLTPNLHVGRGQGSKAFLQTSTGGILGYEQQNPGATKSGVISWEVE